MRDRESEDRYGPDVNRREFLKGSGVAVAAGAVATSVAEGAQQAKKAKVAPDEVQEVKLMVNGKSHSVMITPRVTLLDALHNDLSLTGCKEVCDTTNCGACTVLVDGQPVLACTRLAIAEQGKQITTSEGLGDKVSKCFVKHDATQCGYCTPGFVVAVTAFCQQHPNASLDDVNKGLGGNICRCGTYAGVLAAALECAKGGA